MLLVSERTSRLPACKFESLVIQLHSSIYSCHSIWKCSGANKSRLLQ